MAQFFKSLTCIVLGYNLGADGDITSAFRQKCFSCTVNSVNWVVKFQPTTFKISWIFAARNYMQTWLTIIQITTNWSYHDRLRLHGYLWHTVRHKDIQDDTHIVLVEALTLFQSGETYYAHNIGFSSHRPLTRPPHHPYLIFVTNITNGICGDKICHEGIGSLPLSPFSVLHQCLFFYL